MSASRGPVIEMIHGQPAYAVGPKMINPPGWKPRWMWTGQVIDYPPVEYVNHGTRRAKAPPHLARWRKNVPVLVFVDKHWDWTLHRKKDEWIDAEEMPEDLKESILDCYGSDLTPAMRSLCARQIAERAAIAKAGSARGPRRESAATAPAQMRPGRAAPPRTTRRRKMP